MEDSRKHKFHETHIELHNDGSATVHHIHESGDPKQDVKHAAADLDGVHDSFQEHLNPEEIESKLEKKGVDYGDMEKAEEKISPGIHQKMAGMFGKDKSE